MEIKQIEYDIIEELLSITLNCGYSDVPFLIDIIKNARIFTENKIIDLIEGEFSADNFENIMANVILNSYTKYQEKIAQYISDMTNDDFNYVYNWLEDKIDKDYYINFLNTNVGENYLSRILFQSINEKEIFENFEEAKKHYLEEYEKEKRVGSEEE